MVMGQGRSSLSRRDHEEKDDEDVDGGFLEFAGDGQDHGRFGQPQDDAAGEHPAQGGVAADGGGGEALEAKPQAHVVAQPGLRPHGQGGQARLRLAKDRAWQKTVSTP